MELEMAKSSTMELDNGAGDDEIIDDEWHWR
jgi:hypothetical protein